ncbi:MAG: ABC transporter permease [Chloroflexi bacterium]|nr:ABC transporter permease [Chloroflexota bacterium]HEV8053360.1 ABC transporter permease [Candidatus Limnocylindrales bacterium]
MILLTIAKSLTRIFSQARKELLQVTRRPAAFASLILGPFLLMALFGAGFTGVRAPLTTVLVIPPELDLPRDAQFYQDLSGPALRIVGIADRADEALASLDARDLDLVVIAPADATQALREGRQAEITVAFDEIDPALDTYDRVLAYNLSQAVNKEIITRAVQEGEAYALAQLEGQGDLTQIPPEVIAAPTRANTVNQSPVTPSIVHFFAPAILALILQHMAVTMSALSLVRERLSGTMELFRVSPATSMELLAGKYIGFAVISAIIATAIVLLVVYGLGTPMLGSPLALAAILALVVFASLGLGLLISVIADSERQAVQLALLVLLASVFFSGIVLPVQDFRVPVQVLSYVLPVTHGITLLQNVMLRGEIGDVWQIAVLGVEGLILFILTALLLRRQLHQSVRG